MPETAVKPAKFKAEFYPDSADKSPFESKIAEQGYSAYPYALPLRCLREESFLIILSAPTAPLSLGAESCSRDFSKVKALDILDNGHIYRTYGHTIPYNKRRT